MKYQWQCETLSEKDLELTLEYPRLLYPHVSLKTFSIDVNKIELKCLFVIWKLHIFNFEIYEKTNVLKLLSIRQSFGLFSKRLDRFCEDFR